MPYTSVPITIKDATGTNQTIQAYTDGTASNFSQSLLDNTGAIIAPSTSGLQTTGNTSLASIATNTANIPAQGQALASASLPVVLTAAQITTLTPITGGSTAANQATEITSLASIVTNTANILAKGSATSANSSPVVIASDQGAVATSSPVPLIATGTATAHTAVTTAYAFGQLWANNATAGSVVFEPITVSRANNQAFTIIGGLLKKSGVVTTNALFRIHLFNAAPTTAVADYGTFQANLTLANWIGSLDATVNQAGSDVSWGMMVPSLGSVICNIPVSGAETLYYAVEVRGAYTPVSAESVTPVLFLQ